MLLLRFGEQVIGPGDIEQKDTSLLLVSKTYYIKWRGKCDLSTNAGLGWASSHVASLLIIPE
jgi:hypothetical protein